LGGRLKSLAEYCGLAPHGGLAECSDRGRGSELPVVAKFKPGKRDYFIQMITDFLKPSRLTNKADRIHCSLNKCTDVVAAAVLALSSDQCQSDAFPFWVPTLFDDIALGKQRREFSVCGGTFQHIRYLSNYSLDQRGYRHGSKKMVSPSMKVINFLSVCRKGRGA
jgi:hypothetical protein